MITFNYETDFELANETELATWLSAVIESEDFREGEINYIFCDDAYLHKLNVEFLQHDTLTDILSFDYTMGKLISGDIYISVERVTENAVEYGVEFSNELRRVLVHGILHYCGFKDESDTEAAEMRAKENFYIAQDL